MSWFYRTVIRPALFTHDAEEIHGQTMRGLAWVSRHEMVCDVVNSFLGAPSLPVELFGLQFPNPIGLAAGMDKHAEAVPAWAALGFGFAELGGVTWLPQSGNPQPRIFRAIPERAIVNRMGFNNEGAEALARQLSAWRVSGRWPKHPVGINLGKSKVTPLESAATDYASSFRVLRNHADFFVVNVSSPNTPNLRQLQDKKALDEILAALQQVQNDLSGTTLQPAKPILVKVAPDLSNDALDEIVQLAAPRNIVGFIATNTTTTRPLTHDLTTRRIFAESGGLSGAPLRARSTEVIRHLFRSTRGKIPVVGVGGILDPDDAWEKVTAGASLLQLYTGLVFEGPTLPRALVAGLHERLVANGFKTLVEAVGTAA